MMIAMMFGMGHGVHRLRGHHGHDGGDNRGAAGADGVEGDRAVGILRERYARGELTREQYDDMRRELG